MAAQQQQQEGAVTPLEAGKRAGGALTEMIVYIVVYVIVAAALQFLMSWFHVIAYFKYVNAILVLAFGWYIVNSFADFIYWTMRGKYDHATAVAFKNMMRIIGIIAIIAAVVGAAVGGVGGLTIGGFLGIVVGFVHAAGHGAGGGRHIPDGRKALQGRRPRQHTGRGRHS